MRQGFLWLTNVVLLLICTLAVGHLAYRWNELRPRVVFRGVGCRDIQDAQAHELALICQAVIEAEGPLPRDPARAGRAIAANAAKLGFGWPANYEIGKNGEIRDCAGNPFQLLVSADRVAITSAALYGFYFADLKNPNITKHAQ